MYVVDQWVKKDVDRIHAEINLIRIIIKKHIEHKVESIRGVDQGSALKMYQGTKRRVQKIQVEAGIEKGAEISQGKNVEVKREKEARVEFQTGQKIKIKKLVKKPRESDHAQERGISG